MFEAWNNIAYDNSSSNILFVHGVNGDPYSYSFNYTKDERHIKLFFSWEMKIRGIPEGRGQMRLEEIYLSFYEQDKEPDMDYIMQCIRARSFDAYVEIPETKVSFVAKPKTWFNSLFQRPNKNVLHHWDQDLSERFVIHATPADFLPAISNELSSLAKMYPEQKITLRNDYEDAETLKYYLHFRVTELPIDEEEILQVLELLTSIVKKMVQFKF